MSDTSTALVPIDPHQASEGALQARRRAARADITTSLLPLAVAAAEAMLLNPQTKDAARATIIRTVFEFSVGKLDDTASSKQLHEMTYDEVQEAIEALRDEQRSRVIEAEIIPELRIDDPLELFGEGVF